MARFSIHRLQGCCGVNVVHDVEFDHVLPVESEYLDLWKRIVRTNQTNAPGGPCCKIIMTDKVHDSERASIEHFCKKFLATQDVHVQYGSPTYNQKSMNKIQIFEIDMTGTY